MLDGAVFGPFNPHDLGASSRHTDCEIFQVRIPHGIDPLQGRAGAHLKARFHRFLRCIAAIEGEKSCFFGRYGITCRRMDREQFAEKTGPAVFGRLPQGPIARIFAEHAVTL